MRTSLYNCRHQAQQGYQQSSAIWKAKKLKHFLPILYDCVNYSSVSLTADCQTSRLYRYETETRQRNCKQKPKHIAF